jgi:NMD protein affecting ribosome stability and mRNA decay
VIRSTSTCARCGASADAPSDGLPEGWSLAASARGVDRLCADCTRENVRAIEARLDEEWW